MVIGSPAYAGVAYLGNTFGTELSNVSLGTVYIYYEK